MAKTLTDEDIKLNLIINGNAAQKELHELDDATRTLRKNSASLREEKQKLEKQNQRNSAEYKRVTAELKANNAEIKKNEARMETLRQEIGLTSLTMNQLSQRAKILRLSLNNAVPGSGAYKRYEAELQAINTRMAELRTSATATRFSIGNLADGFNRYAALGASVLATLTGVVLSAQKVIDVNSELSDSQSDVMKTTGMTKKEVDELTKSFGLFKTRSARIELLGLATEAGRLGIEGVDNVRAFVEEANKMKVALGDDLSDDAIREVGKMVNVYKVGEETGKDFAGSMDALGSSINEVSASGANQAGFLVDYLKRQAGVAQITKLSAADNIGYAATFDEVGQSVEVSATAMNKVWLEMMKSPQEFAKVAGVSMKDFKKIMDTDANAAMIMFLEAVGKNQGAASDLLASLSEIEAGGVRGDQAILALAKSTDLLKEKQKISNQALIEATSLTNEYTLKNENLAATYAKIQKTMMGWFSSENIVNGLTSFFEWFAKLIGATEDLDGSVTKFKNGLIMVAKVIVIFTAALAGNVVWQKITHLWINRNTQSTWLYTMAVRARSVAERLSMIVTQAYAAVTMLLQGNLRGAAQAFRVMTAAMMTTPWGLVMAGIAAVVAAFFMFRSETQKTATAQEKLLKLQKDASALAEDETKRVKVLLKIAQDEKASKEARLKAIKDLNDVSPLYLGNLNLENIATKEATKAVYAYIEAKKKELEITGLLDAIRESQKRQREAEMKSNEDYISEAKTAGDILKEIFLPGTVSYDDYIRKGGMARKDAISEELEMQKVLWKRYEEMYIKNPTVGINPDAPVTPIANDDKAKQAREKRLEDLKKLAEERIKIEREAEDAILANMDEGNQKRWQLEQTEYTRKIQDLQARLVSETEIEKALTASKNKALSKEQRDFHAQQAKYWIDSNKHVYSLIESAEATHQLKLETIREHAALDRLKMIDDAYSLERVAKEKVFLQQLNDDKVFGEQRQKALEAFKVEQDEREAEMLRHKIAELQRIMQGEKIEGVDFSLLTDEQLNKLDADLVEMLKRLNELSDAKNKLTQSDLQGLGLNTNTDILGFSPDNWAYFFQNLKDGKFGIEQMAFAVQGLTNMYGQFAEFQTASENANLRNFEKNTDARKRGLKKQLDNGFISQAEYNRKIEETDALLDRKKAELEYKQAKRARLIALANIINNTAQAIIGIWAEVPKADFGISAGVLTGFVSALGALQLATVLKTPLPAKGYETGLYPEYIKREQDGKTFKASYGGKTKSGMVNKPTYFLAGENSKPEMIIDNKAFSQLSDQTRNALIMELRGIKGFENGFYSEKSQRIEIPSAPPSAPVQDPNSAMMLSVMVRLTDVLEKIESDGVLAKVLANDYKSMRHLREGLKNYENLKEKNKN